MSDCRWTSESLDAFLDGELTPEERGRIDAHLAACPQCREALEDLKGLDGFLRQATERSDGARGDIDRVASTVVSRIVFRRRAVRASLAIAALFLISVTVYVVAFFTPGGEPDERAMANRIAELFRGEGGEAAAREIHAMGDRAIPILVRFLSSDDVRTQLAASRLLALCADRQSADLIARAAKEQGVLESSDDLLGDFGGDRGDVEAIPALVKLLKTGSPREQIRASELLCRFADPAAIDAAIALAAREGLCADDVVGDDEWTIGELGSDADDVRVLPILLSMAGRPATRAFALDALRRMGLYHRSEVVNALLPLLASANDADQRLAQDVILHADIAFVPADLVELLDHADLGAPAHRMLVEISERVYHRKTDLGMDKGKWRKWLNEAEAN